MFCASLEIPTLIYNEIVFFDSRRKTPADKGEGYHYQEHKAETMQVPVKQLTLNTQQIGQEGTEDVRNFPQDKQGQE